MEHSFLPQSLRLVRRRRRRINILGQDGENGENVENQSSLVRSRFLVKLLPLNLLGLLYQLRLAMKPSPACQRRSLKKEPGKRTDRPLPTNEQRSQSKAEAIRLYAIQAKDTELETMAAEIKLRAARRLGEMSKELEKGAGRPSKKIPLTNEKNSKDKAAVLKNAGLTVPTANRYETLASVSEEKFEKYIDGEKKKKQPVYAQEVMRMVPKEETRKG